MLSRWKKAVFSWQYCCLCKLFVKMYFVGYNSLEDEIIKSYVPATNKTVEQSVN